MRAVFGLEVGLGEIFTDDAEEEKLDAAYEHDNTDEAGPTGGGIAEGKGFDDNDNDNNEGDEAEEDAKESGEGEGDGREGDDAFNSVFEKLPERPFGFAGDALDVFVFDPFGFEADKSPETFGITVILSAREDSTDDLAGHEAVVAGAVDHFDFAHAVDEFIENAGAEAADRRLALAGDAAGGGAIPAFCGGVGWVNVAEEFGKEAGRVLAIGVHGGDEIASGGFKAGEQGGFFAKVAGERNVEDARIVFGERFHDFESIVAAAVVDKDKLEFVIRKSVDGFQGFLIKEGKRGGFVITWDDNTDSFHTFIIS